MIESLPKQMGNFRLLEQLGAGGMGIVYRAEDSSLGREVAVKVLHPHLLANTELKARFEREARLHASLTHPNVVTLYNIYEHDGNLALIMEMVHGQNLKEYLRSNKKQTLENILHIAQSILAGLDSAHQLGMVHRDLKPANVLLSTDGQIKLMDFGLAKLENTDDDLTKSGAVVGSYRYMAPEQIMHEPIDARTDLYAFGILLYQMLTGQLPFDASSQGGGEFEVMEKQMRASPPPPQELNPSLPASVVALLLQLLEKKPAQRPENCQAVIDALEQVLTGTDEHTVIPIASTYEQRDQPSAAAIAGGLINAASDGAIHWWQHELPKPLQRAALPVLLLSTIAFLLLQFLPSDDQSHVSQVPMKESMPSNMALPQQAYAQLTHPIKDQYTSAKEGNTLNVKATKQQKPARVKTAQKTILKSLTSTHKYQLKRSDFTRPASGQKHEFTGGSHLFFKSLGSYALKRDIRAFGTAFSRITFSQPVNVSQIVLHKASVGDLNYIGGNIQVSVRGKNGAWIMVLNRQGKDIERRLSIKIDKNIGKVRQVKVSMKSPEPLELGPIEVFP